MSQKFVVDISVRYVKETMSLNIMQTVILGIVKDVLIKIALQNMTVIHSTLRYGSVERAIEINFASRRGVPMEKQFMKKHGKVKGKKLYKEYLLTTDQSLKGFIRRYGKKKGTSRFNKFVKNSVVTEDNFIKRHGEKRGKEKWNDLQNRKRKTNPRVKSNWIKWGYSDKYAKQQVIKLQGRTEKTFIHNYGIREGKRKYKEYCQSKTNRVASKVSNRSTELFEAIFKQLKFDKRKVKIYYGDNEYVAENLFKVDFAIPKYKIAVEFFGDIWHMNPKIYSAKDKCPIGKNKAFDIGKRIKREFLHYEV